MSDTGHKPMKAAPARPRRRRRRGVTLCLLLLFGGPAVFMWLATPAPGPVALPGVDASSRYDVYVTEEYHHTAIIIEQPRGWRLGPPGREAAAYVEYAWGDRRYYKDTDRRWYVTAMAVLLPTDAVVYVRGRDAPPPTRPLYHRSVTAAQLVALATALEQSIERTGAGGRAEPYPPVPNYSGRFYPSRQYYIFWSSCNTWTVARLHEAGMADTALGVVASGQVAGRLESFATADAAE